MMFFRLFFVFALFMGVLSWPFRLDGFSLWVVYTIYGKCINSIQYIQFFFSIVVSNTKTMKLEICKGERFRSRLLSLTWNWKSAMCKAQTQLILHWIVTRSSEYKLVHIWSYEQHLSLSLSLSLSNFQVEKIFPDQIANIFWNCCSFWWVGLYSWQWGHCFRLIKCTVPTNWFVLNK